MSELKLIVYKSVISSLVPILFSSIGTGSVFAIFAVMMIFQLLFVVFIMPETKGVSLEELTKKLVNR